MHAKRFYFSEQLSILNTMGKLVIRTATMNDIPSIVNVRLASTVKGETQGFEAPEWARIDK